MGKPSGEKNYYRLMQIPMDSTKDEIKRQYKRLCLSWHPDKNPTEEGRDRFDALQEAYRFLLDDAQRDAYDFGNWKNKPVRHHVKGRERVRNVLESNPTRDDIEDR